MVKIIAESWVDLVVQEHERQCYENRGYPHPQLPSTMTAEISDEVLTELRQKGLQLSVGSISLGGLPTKAILINTYRNN